VKIKIVLEMEVSDVPDDEQHELLMDDEDIAKASDYSAIDIAEILETDGCPDMWTEFLAGGGVWVNIDKTTVTSAEIIQA
jgi:hypothetical protein